MQTFDADCNHHDDIEPGRRFPKGIFHHVDDAYYSYVIKVADAIRAIEPASFASHKLTPNAITLFVNVSRVLVFFSAFTNRPLLACLFTFLQYFGDDLDGHYARRYCQETLGGDIFDHVGDAMFLTAVLLGFVYLWPKLSWMSRGMVVAIVVYAAVWVYLFGKMERLRTNVDPAKMWFPSTYTDKKDRKEREYTTTLLRAWPHAFFCILISVIFLYVILRDFHK